MSHTPWPATVLSFENVRIGIFAMAANGLALRAFSENNGPMIKSAFCSIAAVTAPATSCDVSWKVKSIFGLSKVKIANSAPRRISTPIFWAGPESGNRTAARKVVSFLLTTVDAADSGKIT